MNKTQEIAKLVAKLNADTKLNQLSTYSPYPWQEDFHDAGKDNPERMLMAANRVGKTASASAECAMHLTGQYPDWWTGKRFDRPTLVWTGSPTNETSRDIVQKALIGSLGDGLGTGWIPKNKIIGKPTTRIAGVKGVADAFRVRHISGGVSECVMKTYEQGWQKWQGSAPHVVWMDEEPDDYMIFSESQTRILTSNGIVMVTFTPLLGRTELVMHFEEGIKGVYIKGASWNDAPHLSEDDKTRLSSSYREHERAARTQGIPMLGEGAVFPVLDEDIMVKPFDIPDHYARIKGCDFGIDHPAAGVEIAWDRDADVIYVIGGYKASGEKAPYHAAWLQKGSHARVIPIAWPHDGDTRDKGDGKQLAQRYRAYGANMMNKSARYPKQPGEKMERGGSQPMEPIIDEVLERMLTGRLKVFANFGEWFEEKRSYHRKKGLIVKKRDDLLSATFYAIMMKRYAVPLTWAGKRVNRGPARPLSSMRL